MFEFNHFNFNVLDLDRSLKFYDEAFGLKPVRVKDSEDGSYRLVFLGDGRSDFRLELTYIKNRQKPYDLGEQEFHLAFAADDIDKAREKHRKMGIICQDTKPGHSFYFVEDPDGYWIEVVRNKKNNENCP